MSKNLKIGLVGLGPIGSLHIDNLTSGNIKNCELVCVCDTRKVDNPKIAHLPFFSSVPEMLANGGIDAVIVATPSFTHFNLAKEILGAGKNVLVEKPLSLCSADALKLFDIAKKANKQCAVMLNQRTTPIYMRLKSMVANNEFGEIKRVSWNMTNWFRPQIYFEMSPWRGLWKGEAGGVLINQAIHNIDAFAWIFGLPKKLRAWAKFGKYHDIEVEDEVTAYMEYDKQMTATFMTSSGEHPGTNRLEISGDKMFVVAENNELKISEFDGETSSSFLKNTKYCFGTPKTIERVEKFEGKGAQHAGVLQNYVNACLGLEENFYDAKQGYLSLALANAMLFSGIENCDVEFPFNDEAYEKILTKLQSKSELRKNIRTDFILDFSKSFR